MIMGLILGHDSGDDNPGSMLNAAVSIEDFGQRMQDFDSHNLSFDLDYFQVGC